MAQLFGIFRQMVEFSLTSLVIPGLIKNAVTLTSDSNPPFSNQVLDI